MCNLLQKNFFKVFESDIINLIRREGVKMITAINTANRNNIQNNVNFKAGRGIREIIPYAITDELMTALKTGLVRFEPHNTMIDNMTKHPAMPWVFHAITAHLGLPIETMKKCWDSINFAKIGEKFDDLQDACAHVAGLRRFSPFHAIIIAKPWDRLGRQGTVDDFKPEFLKFMRDYGLMDERANLVGIPAKEMIIRPGYQKFEDGDFTKQAQRVTILGTETESPVMESVDCDALAIQGAKIPQLKAKASAAIVNDSTIGSIVAEKELSVGNSTINGDVTSKTHANFVGQNNIVGGNVQVANSLEVTKDSNLVINGNARFTTLNLRQRAQLDVKGEIGAEKDLVDNIFIEHNAGLKAGETHAGELHISKGGQFETDVLDVREVPFGVKLDHSFIGKLARWGRSLAENAITAAEIMQK